MGREGPIAQVGGAIGSAVAQIRKLSADRAKVLIAAGAGAGIATTFNAPIGGLMFAQEIVLLGHTELANLTLLIIATFTGVVTSRAILGNAAVFHVQQFVLRSYWEMVTYALMGAADRPAGRRLYPLLPCDGGAFRRLEFRFGPSSRAGLALVGLIAICAARKILSDGYPVINGAMAGQYRHRDAGGADLRQDSSRAASRSDAARRAACSDRFSSSARWLVGCSSACSAHPDAAADRPARLVRAGRARSVSGRNHARAADRAVSAFEMTQNYTVTLPA